MNYGLLASHGRNEDNSLMGGEVAHISKLESALLKLLGGGGTTNPVTGLPEYFFGSPMGLSMMGLRGVIGAGRLFGGGGGGGGGYHPLNHSGMSIYGPIANLPQHYRRAVYTGLPMGGHGMGISQRSIKEMQDRNLAPPGVQTHFGAKARSGPDALRALNVKKNLDPEYLPSGELRPPPEQEGQQGAQVTAVAPAENVAPVAPSAPTAQSPGIPIVVNGRVVGGWADLAERFGNTTPPASPVTPLTGLEPLQQIGQPSSLI